MGDTLKDYYVVTIWFARPDSDQPVAITLPSQLVDPPTKPVRIVLTRKRSGSYDQVVVSVPIPE